MDTVVRSARSFDALRTAGPFTRRDALAHQVDPWALRVLLDEGQLRRVLRGVYVDAAHEDCSELRVRAAALVVPPHAVVVDRSAAWLWAVDVRRPEELATVPRLEVFVLRGHKRLTRREAAGGERDLVARDVCVVGGVQVTTPLRTALDLACGLSRYEALATLDAFGRGHALPAPELQRELVRFRGRRGVVQARRLVPLMDPRAESSGESFTRMAVLDAGLPCPELQHWVLHDGVPVFRLDLAYPARRVCVEYDGVEFHTGAERTAADLRRRRWLEARGWVVIVVTKDDFRGPALETWQHVLRGALAAAR